MITIHRFESTSDAYDRTQWDDSIADGDVLVVESERVVGVLTGAWPVAVTDEHGALHALADDVEWDNVPRLIDGRTDYSAARDVALAIADALWGPVDPDHDPEHNPRVVPTGDAKTTEGISLLKTYPVGARVEFTIAPDPWTPEGVSGTGTVAGVLEDVQETGSPESGPSMSVWVAVAVWHDGTLYGLHPEDGDSTLRVVDAVQS